MAHYAFIDEENIVTQVIVGRNENDIPEGITSWEKHYGKNFGQRCIRTSYNASIRKNFASVGFTYDESLDAFIPPKPFDSWILDEETCLWNAPVPKPEGNFKWDESVVNWVEVQGE